MAVYSIASINTAIEETLATATGIQRAQDLAEITDQIPDADMPLLQVYPDSWSGAANSGTHQNTFGGKGTNTTSIKVREWTFIADIYVARHAVFGEAMVKLATIAAALQDVLDAQEVTPLFGDASEAIKSFQYSAERVTFEYSQAKYLGIRITLTLMMF